MTKYRSRLASLSKIVRRIEILSVAKQAHPSHWHCWWVPWGHTWIVISFWRATVHVIIMECVETSRTS